MDRGGGSKRLGSLGCVKTPPTTTAAFALPPPCLGSYWLHGIHAESSACLGSESVLGRLTTHVLDTALGRPAAGLAIALFRDGPSREEAARAVTNEDGRCDAPLLQGDALTVGTYELVFQAGAYLSRVGIDLPEPKFLDQIVIRFGVADAAAHYHVPLLLSPYGYSTYRGS